MNFYVIYEKPSDYPDHWVLRRWSILGDGRTIPDRAEIYNNLDEAREHIPSGFFRIARAPGDDPVIAETWI